MDSFVCDACGQLLFFDNSVCLRCGSMLGFDPGTRRLLALTVEGDVLRPVAGGVAFRSCGNQLTARCNWLIPEEDGSVLCASCRLTTIRPNDAEVDAMAAFADAEAAKRRLLFQLIGLGLPVDGVSFEFLSSRGRQVITGHDQGVITLDLSESDDAHREFVRLQLGEAYRTVLGHLRHETGHYYWPVLVERAGHLDRFRALFGNEQMLYEEAHERHYAEGPPPDWATAHVSEYATMHPWEDWAETFAHYLHIQSGLETARAFGLHIADPSATAGQIAASGAGHLSIGPMIERWLGMTLGLNAMARAIGQSDLYPFVLAPAVVEKLDFVHRVVGG